jgi:uncharacterized membrane protein
MHDCTNVQETFSLYVHKLTMTCLFAYLPLNRKFYGTKNYSETTVIRNYSRCSLAGFGVLWMQKSVFLKFSASSHELVKLVRIVICQVAVILIEQSLNVLIEKVKSHFSAFIYEGFSMRNRYLELYLVLACSSENGIAALRSVHRCWCKPPKRIIKQGCF